MVVRESGRARSPRGAVIAVVALVAICCVACAGSRPSGHGPSPTAPPTGPTSDTTATVVRPGTTTTAVQGCPQRVLASLTDAQLVGQLFMIGDKLSAPDASTLEQVQDLAVGGVILYGNSDTGVAAIGMLTARLRAADAKAIPGVGPYIATDQEGGQIQELSGPGFARIPSAVAQGTIDPGQLRVDAQQWGTQLAHAGVNVDLGPVLDVVPPAFEPVNQPIAHYDRQLGSDPATVATHGVALVNGLQAAGVGATLKHFPGLGRVVGDTDFTANVEDTTTTRHDPFLASFVAGIKAGADFVLVSLAGYRQIDPANQAVFSSVVMKDMLRGDLGFRGLIISDDMGAAQAVLDVAPGQRAVRFLEAGGDIVVAVKPMSVFAPMVAGVEAEVGSSPAFRALVDADALAVLTAKQEAGLLTCP